MKKYLIITVLIFSSLGCGSDSFNNSNPNIPTYHFTLDLNLNLPSYSNLQFASNHIINSDVGARGIVVFNTGSGYIAFDLACPNVSYSTCTTAMTVSGIEAKCACDTTTYNLFTGLCSGQTYPMKQYRTELNGSILTVYN